MKHDEQVPFFARFLEAQEYPEVESDVTAGWKPPPPTNPLLDMDQTMKYPSDSDEV